MECQIEDMVEHVDQLQAELATLYGLTKHQACYAAQTRHFVLDPRESWGRFGEDSPETLERQYLGPEWPDLGSKISASYRRLAKERR